MDKTGVASRRAEFRRLHQSGCFVMPNPWDVGSARILEQLGFAALATTSAGSAWSLGRGDSALAVEEVLTHLELIVGAVETPVNADFEAGYADTPEVLMRNVAAAVDTGVAGLSIEDRTGADLYPLEAAADRVRAARQAIGASGVVLTGRCEAYLVGRRDLAEVIERLKAYAEAGAECLYAPGLSDRSEIEQLVGALAPRPVNLLLSTPALTVAQAAAMGVRRISVGSGLAALAYGELIRAARAIRDEGSFERFARKPEFTQLNSLFADRG